MLRCRPDKNSYQLAGVGQFNASIVMSLIMFHSLVTTEIVNGMTIRLDLSHYFTLN